MKHVIRTTNHKPFRVLAIAACLLALSAAAPAQLSHSPREVGEEMLGELLMGANQIVVSVASNGCTDKASFTLDLKKLEGLSAKAPHYLVTIKRVKADACKAIVTDGVWIVFDLEKDAGLKGHYTYAVTNRVLSSAKAMPADQSLWDDIKRHVAPPPAAEAKSAKAPTPAAAPALPPTPPAAPAKARINGAYVMAHSYFSCTLPPEWTVEEDLPGCEQAGIFEIKLTWPGEAQAGADKGFLLPDPLIYAGYYAARNEQHKTYDDFIQDYLALVKKNKANDRTRYEQPTAIKFAGLEAKAYTYEVSQEIRRGPVAATKFWLKARLIVAKAKEGFYVLAYKSPKDLFDAHLPEFEKLVASFKPLE
jgi:hypothetical protein